MAKIDTNKFRPQNRTENRGLSSQRVSVSSGVSSGSTPNINPSDVKPEENETQPKKTLLSEVIEIRRNLLLILKLVKGNNSLLKKSEERQRKEQEQQKFQEKELKSEEKKNKLIPDFKPTEFPKMGFLDRIKQFLFYTVLGAAFTKFGKHIPQVLGLLKNLGPAFTTFETITGNILNGFVDFVGFGYKAYDKVKEIIVGISGDDTEKRLQEFDKQFNTFANLAIIAGMTAAGSADFSGGGGKKERLGVDKQTGQRVSKRAQARYLNQYGQDAYIKKFGKRSFTGLTGKAPSRFAGRLAGKALGKVPIIGGLVDFIISTVIFKEKPGRAAAKAVGATIGSALGTFVPVPFAGTILGGILGDIVGGALYDSLVGGDKLKAKAQGGQATRGGKRVSAPIKRTIKRTRPKPTKIKPQKTIPGKDVGGREEIKKLFPSPTNPRQKNPLGTLENASKNYKERVPLIGGIMGAAIDSTMGQRPDPTTFKRIGTGFGHLIQNAIDAETNGTIAGIQNQIVGLAAGGMVPRTLSTNENIGMKIGESIGKALEAMVNSQVNNTLQSIRQQFTKEDYMTPGGGAPDGGGGDGDGSVFDGDYKEILDLIASVEGGYDSLNVGGAAGGTIAYGSSTATKQFGKPFSQMTVEQVMQLQKEGKIHATGRYQIIKTTLEGLMSGSYGNTGVKKTDFYNAETQDRLGIALVNYRLRTGANVRNFRSEWIGLRKIDDQKLQRAIDKAKGGNIGTIRLKGLPPTGTLPGQQYGDPRGGGRKHAGVDFDAGLNDTFYSRIGGEVIYAANAGGGYGNVVDVYNKQLNVTERIAEGTQNLVTVGQKIKPGTPVQRGTHQTGVFHYEIRKGRATGSGDFSGTINPLKFLNSLQKKTQSPNIAKPDTRPSSPPPTQVRTNPTRDQWKPEQSGLEQLPDGTYRKRASLAPASSQKIASGLNQQASYEIAGGFTLARQTMIIEKSMPTPVGGGIVNNIASTQSFNQTQATLANA
jgi:murein DD-endopeptidase MepM/ murein hydrolase activator NlpD